LKDIGAALAWEPAGRGRRAIEVYPAATLEACCGKGKVSPYKKPRQRPAREKIVDCLSELMTIEGEMRKSLLADADQLDAAVCVLAGADFLLGKSLAPEGKCRDTSRKEGWIWVRDPRKKLI
jgi:predicted RNase H-like nuclease